MGMTVQSGNITSTITGAVSTSSSFPQPATSQTLKTALVNGNGASDVTLFTATAGKTAYVTLISHRGGAASNMQLKNHAGTVICNLMVLINDTKILNNGGYPMFIVNGGETLKITTHASNDVFCSYFEV